MPHPRPEASVHDLAEHPRTPAVRRRSEERYRELYDDVPLMYFRLDRHGHVLSVNRHGARQLGYESGELAGRSVLEVFHPQDRPAARQQFRWALDFPHELARWELRKVRRDGSVLWVRETVRVVDGADGAPELLVICEDVTERRRAVERLAEYRDQLRELNAELLDAEEREHRRIARVLHDELGQTLAVARMAICELEDSESSAARAGRLEKIRADLDRSIEVTRSLTFELSPPILHELGLPSALEALGERTEAEHGVRFVFARGDGWSTPAEEVGVVLYRAVRELMHNVVKHARASRVRLELDRFGDRLRIVLEDDGVGFDAAGVCCRGRSLGLFQVRERMDLLGGRFDLDSAPGRGTRAELSLPLASEERSP